MKLHNPIGSFKKRANLHGINKFNILMGKVGAGKSLILQEIGKTNSNAVYIPPERGSSLLPDRNNQEDGLLYEKTFINTRNQLANYKRALIDEFFDFVNGKKQARIRHYETLINSLLMDIKIQINLNVAEKDEEFQKDTRFVPHPNQKYIFNFIKFIEKDEENEKSYAIIAKDLSSGENEIVPLAMEILIFFEGRQFKQGESYYLLLDSPDVHLHPDAQQRLINFIFRFIQDKADIDIHVIIATHSTAILGALTEIENSYPNTANICFLNRSLWRTPASSIDLFFTPIGDTYNLLVPIFGGHSLTQVFNERPILLVEGMDDEWVWKLLASKGAIRLYPCPTGGTGKMPEVIAHVNRILNSIYEDSRAYCIRDRDKEKKAKIIDENIEAVIKKEGLQNKVTFLYLHCYAIENLCFTDEFLKFWGVTWENLVGIDKFFKRTDRGFKRNCKTPHAQLVAFLYRQQDERKSRGEKNVIQLCWQEALVRVIQNAIRDIKKVVAPLSTHSIYAYLGQAIFAHLFNVDSKILNNLFGVDTTPHVDTATNSKQPTSTTSPLPVLEFTKSSFIPINPLVTLLRQLVPEHILAKVKEVTLKEIEDWLEEKVDRTKTTRVSKILKKIAGLSVGKKLFIPININNDHFTLLAIMKNSHNEVVAVYLDSFGDYQNSSSMVNRLFKDTNAAIKLTMLRENYQDNNDCAIHVYEAAKLLLEANEDEFNSTWLWEKIKALGLNSPEIATSKRLNFANRVLARQQDFLNIYSEILINEELASSGYKIGKEEEFSFELQFIATNNWFAHQEKDLNDLKEKLGESESDNKEKALMLEKQKREIEELSQHLKRATETMANLESQLNILKSRIEQAEERKTTIKPKLGFF